MEGPLCSASIAIDISKMKDGDRTGFAAFNGDSGLLTISNENGKIFLSMQTASVKLSDKDKAVEGVDISDQSRIAIKSKKIYLRIDGDFNPSKDIATFYYSTDGKKWEKTGIDFKMRFDYRRFFMGTKYAIFNYATKALGGYIDIDNFSFRKF